MKLRDYLYFNRIKKCEFAAQIGKTNSYVSTLCDPDHPMECSIGVALIIEEATRGQVTPRDLCKKKLVLKGAGNGD